MSCDKFEKLFIQDTEDELLEHIQSCEVCMLEYKKMKKTESLIQEVRPLLQKQKNKIAYAKIAAAFALVIVSSFVIMNNFYAPKLCYEDSNSAVMPVDEYGLLDIQ